MDRSVRHLKGVGQKRAALYEKLKIFSYGDLLRHYPRGYLNYADVQDLDELPVGSMTTVRAVVDTKTPAVRTKGGRTIARVFASTEAGQELELVFFNNPYATRNLFVGQEYIFYGKLQGDLLRRQMTNPVLVRQDEMEGLTPQYPLTEGLSSRMVATNVKAILSDPECCIEEFLPDEVMERYRLADRDTAIRDIHFPAGTEDAQQARRRLVFEELFTLTLGMKMRRQRKKVQSENAFSFLDPSAFYASLPFELTGAQKRSVAEIASDLGKSEPMSRLL